MITLKSVIHSHLRSGHYLQYKWLLMGVDCVRDMRHGPLITVIRSCRAATNALKSSTIILPLYALSSSCLSKESDAVSRQLSQMCQSLSHLQETDVVFQIRRHICHD